VENPDAGLIAAFVAALDAHEITVEHLEAVVATLIDGKPPGPGMLGELRVRAELDRAGIMKLRNCLTTLAGEDVVQH